MSTKFRIGDVCTIEVVVDSTLFGDGEIRVRQPEKYGDIYVKESALTMKQAHFRVGDKVSGPYPTGAQKRATILAISEDWVWVKTDAGYETWAKDRVTRVDPEPATEQVEAA